MSIWRTGWTIACLLGLAACDLTTPEQPSLPKTGLLDEKVLLAALNAAPGPVLASGALGTPDARFICQGGDSYRTQASVQEIRRKFGVDVPDSSWRGYAATEMIYVVTPGGERFMPLEAGSKVIAPGGDCFTNDAVFFKEGDRWRLETPPDPNRGSEQGRKLLTKFAAEAGPVPAVKALGVEDAQYICLEAGKVPAQHIVTINTVFHAGLPQTRLPPPQLKYQEDGIYVRSPLGEQFITFPDREGLSPKGEICLEGPDAVFVKTGGEWSLRSRSAPKGFGQTP